jgi:acetolactate synthase-1/2/3 large subunit
LRASLALAGGGLPAPPPADAARPSVEGLPIEERVRRESGHVGHQSGPADEAARVVDPGSGFYGGAARAADIRYVAAMPGSTFRGLQESIVTFGGNKAPEFITCVHEEISAAMCHGYAKVVGRPMACLVHSTVGLQHASMAIYNAWCDKVPIFVLAANLLDETKRRPGVEWVHTMTDLGSMVRDYVKWDDTPDSLQHFSESFMRAYEICRGSLIFASKSDGRICR